MAQIPQRNLLNIKLGSANGIKVNQTRKIDFLSYNDLYNYAINGAAKEFEAKYSDVTFKAGSQEAINVAGLHKEDFMSTTKEALLEELHTELLKTSTNRTVGMGEHLINLGEFSNTGNNFDSSTPIIVNMQKPGAIKTLTPEEQKINDINRCISQFTSGTLSVSLLIDTLSQYDIQYTETRDGDTYIVTFSYEQNNVTKKVTIKSNKQTSKTYSLEQLKEESLTNEKFINEYFYAVHEENGSTKKYALKPEYGFKNINELFKALQNQLILNNFLNDKNRSTDFTSDFRDLSDGKRLSSSNMDDYYNEVKLTTGEDKENLITKVIEKIENDYASGNLTYSQLRTILNTLGLKEQGKNNIPQDGIFKNSFGNVTIWLNDKCYIIYCDSKLSSKSTDDRTVKLYSAEAIEHLSNSEINKYFTPVVTENGVVKQYIIKEGVSTTEVEYLINNKPVGNNIKLKRMISSNSTDEIVQFIKDLLNNKISAQTGLKGDENIKVGHITNGNAFGDKVIETFVNNILMKYCEAYNTNEFSVNMILEGLKSYLASMQKMDMKTDTEGLVKEYKADEFLTAFAKENYGNTNADNVMSQLLLNVKKVYTATTGNNCKYSDDQIKKLINTMLQSNSDSKISAYTIIDNITAVLQEIDLSANEITTDSIKDLSNGLENVLEEYAKICIEAQNYVTTQLKNNSPISFDDYLKYIKSKYPEYNSNEYDEDLKGALVLGITQRLQKAGATNDDILEILEALFKEPSNEIDSSNSSSRSAAHAKKMNNPLIVTPSGIIIDENTSNATSSFIHWWLGVEDKKTTGSEAIQEMIDTFSNIGNITDSDDGWITLRRFIAGICPYVSQLGGIASVVKSTEDLWSMDNPTFGDYAIFTVDAFLNISGFGKTAKKGLKLLSTTSKSFKFLSTKSKILDEILDAMEKNLEPSAKKVLECMDKVHDLIVVNTWNKIKDSLITKKPRSNGQGNDVPQGGNPSRPSGGGSGIGGTSVGGSNSSNTTTGSSNNNYSGNTQGSDSGKTQDNGSNKNDSNSGNNNSQNPDLRDIFGDIDYNDRFGGNPSSSNDDSLNDDFDMTDFGNNGNLNDILGWQSDSNIDHSKDSHLTIFKDPEHGMIISNPTDSWKDGAWTAKDTTRDGKADTWRMQTQDENGKPVTYEQRDTDGDGVADACYRLYTDSNGATVKETTQRNTDGSTNTKRTYTDETGRSTVFETKDANGNVTSVEVHNKDGSITSAEVSRDADGNIVLKQTQTDANGNQIEQTIYGNGNKRTTITDKDGNTVSCDANGNTVVTSKNSDGTTSQYVFPADSTYGGANQGSLIDTQNAFSTTINGGEQIKTGFENAIDQAGSLIEACKNANGGKVTVVETEDGYTFIFGDDDSSGSASCGGGGAGGSGGAEFPSRWEADPFGGFGKTLPGLRPELEERLRESDDSFRNPRNYMQERIGTMKKLGL